MQQARYSALRERATKIIDKYIVPSAPLIAVGLFALGVVGINTLAKDEISYLRSRCSSNNSDNNKPSITLGIESNLSLGDRENLNLGGECDERTQ